MKRPFGITLIAAYQILAAVVLLISVAGSVIRKGFYSTVTDMGFADPHLWHGLGFYLPNLILRNLTLEIGGNVFVVAFLPYALDVLVGVATAIGLLRLRPWALKITAVLAVITVLPWLLAYALIPLFLMDLPGLIRGDDRFPLFAIDGLLYAGVLIYLIRPRVQGHFLTRGV